MNLVSNLLTAEPAEGLWLLCGPPASGKSSFRRHGWSGPVVSPDDLRAEVFGDRYYPRGEGLVWARQRTVPEERLKQMAAAWAPPSRAEGLAAVWMVLQS